MNNHSSLIDVRRGMGEARRLDDHRSDHHAISPQITRCSGATPASLMPTADRIR